LPPLQANSSTWNTLIMYLKYIITAKNKTRISC
jgi:hypothetical protein